MADWQGMILIIIQKRRLVIAAVFKALNYFVSEGEMNDIIRWEAREVEGIYQRKRYDKETLL